MASSKAIDAPAGRPNIDADLQDVAHQLRQEFANRLESCEIDDCVRKVAVTFEDATVTSFVPLLVQRFARDELQARLANA